MTIAAALAEVHARMHGCALRTSLPISAPPITAELTLTGVPHMTPRILYTLSYCIHSN